jgi:hypothetical protein
MPEPLSDEVSPGTLGPGAPSDEPIAAEEVERFVIDQVFAYSRLWSHLVLLGLLALGIFLAFQEMAGYAERARQFPAVTFVVGLVMIAIRAVHLVAVARRDGQPSSEPGRLGREAVMVGWLVALAFALVLLGVIQGAITFLIVYLLVHRPVRLWVTAVVVASVGLSVHVLFVEVLNLPFRPGLLFR